MYLFCILYTSSIVFAFDNWMRDHWIKSRNKPLGRNITSKKREFQRRLHFLRNPTFFKAITHVIARATFLEDAVFSWFSTANLVFTVALSIYHLVINPFKVGAFRLKLPAGAQSGCTIPKLFLLIQWTNILHQIWFLRAALNGTIYWKM